MKLETILQDNGIPFERHIHPTAYTAQGLAHAEHVTGYMVAKPVIVKAGDEFVMCVLPAPKHIDLKRIADVLGVPQATLAREPEMAKVFAGCELGAEPPLGSIFGMKTLMDQSLTNDEFVLMQAGTHTEAVKMRREDWQRVCKPIIASITIE